MQRAWIKDVCYSDNSCSEKIVMRGQKNVVTCEVRKAIPTVKEVAVVCRPWFQHCRLVRVTHWKPLSCMQPAISDTSRRNLDLAITWAGLVISVPSAEMHCARR
jgi:hypothetical protein